MERLLCILLGSFFGLLAGVAVGAVVSGVLWSGYSVSWGEFAPFELFRQWLGMLGSLLGIMGLCLGGAYGDNSY